MEPNYRFRSYKEYLPEKYQLLFNEYWSKREHTMKELLLFLKKIHAIGSGDSDNYAHICEAMTACCEFFFDGEYGGYDAPGNNEDDDFLYRYNEGLNKIIKTLRILIQVNEGKQLETELRDTNQLWRYLGWNIEDQIKIIS